MFNDLLQNNLVLNGLSGDSADKLVASGFDVGVLKPFRGRDGRSYITRTVNGKQKTMVTNAPAALPRDAWIAFDNAVVRAITERLRAYADIRARGLTYDLPNGMGHTMLQYQTAGDISRATISMDGMRRSESDRPYFDIGNLPLPIIHKDFDFSAREIAVSQNGQFPLDTFTAELAAQKVAEEIERLTIGTAGSVNYGGGTIYGYINFPNRATKIDMPVPDGTNGDAVLNAILALRQLLIDDGHPGPYMMYVNSQWSQWLDTDFKAGSDITLRQRILALDDIEEIRVLDLLPATQHHVLLVEMQSQTVRAVNGLEVQTVQWDSLGGMRKHFKVMAIQVPQLRADTAGNSGIAHGRTA